MQLLYQLKNVILVYTIFLCYFCWQYLTQQKCCCIFKWLCGISCIVRYQSIKTKTCCWTYGRVIPFRLLNRSNNTWTVGTASQHIFTVRQSNSLLGNRTHCRNFHVCFCFVYITNMKHHIILVYFNNITFHFSIPSIFRISTVVFEFIQVSIYPC